MVNHPYEEELLNSNSKIRVFQKNISEESLKWHYDEEYREVEVLNDSDWKFQFDNELPITLSKGRTILIPIGKFHRVIRGNTDLKIKITVI